MVLRFFSFLFIGGLSAHAASVLPCTPEILDVQVVPPLEPNTAQRSTHPWRSNSRIAANPAASCQAPLCSCCPRAVPTTFSNSFFSDQELTPTERQFEQNQSLLVPGEWAHVFIAWDWRASVLFPGCINRDRLTWTLGLNPISCSDARCNSRASLDARLRSRLHIALPHGPMRGRADPGGMLKRLNARPADFAPSPIAKSQGSPQPPIDVKTRSDQECCMTTSNSLSSRRVKTRTCPFLAARKREPSGLMKAYINHCKIMSAETERTPTATRPKSLPKDCFPHSIHTRCAANLKSQ